LPKIFTRNYEKGNTPIQAAVDVYGGVCFRLNYQPSFTQSLLFYFPVSWIVGSVNFLGSVLGNVILTLVVFLVEALLLYYRAHLAHSKALQPNGTISRKKENSRSLFAKN